MLKWQDEERPQIVIMLIIIFDEWKKYTIETVCLCTCKLSFFHAFFCETSTVY